MNINIILKLKLGEISTISHIFLNTLQDVNHYNYIITSKKSILQHIEYENDKHNNSS